MMQYSEQHPSYERPDDILRQRPRMIENAVTNLRMAGIHSNWLGEALSETIPHPVLREQVPVEASPVISEADATINEIRETANTYAAPKEALILEFKGQTDVKEAA